MQVEQFKWSACSPVGWWLKNLSQSESQSTINFLGANDHGYPFKAQCKKCNVNLLCTKQQSNSVYIYHSIVSNNYALNCTRKRQRHSIAVISNGSQFWTTVSEKYWIDHISISTNPITFPLENCKIKLKYNYRYSNLVSYLF